MILELWPLVAVRGTLQKLSASYGTKMKAKYSTYICDIIRALTSLVFSQEFISGCSEDWRFRLFHSGFQISGAFNYGKKKTYLASSNSSNPFSKIFSFLYCSKKAFRRLSRSNWSIIRLKSCIVRRCSAFSISYGQKRSGWRNEVVNVPTRY